MAAGFAVSQGTGQERAGTWLQREQTMPMWFHETEDTSRDFLEVAKSLQDLCHSDWEEVSS